MAEPEEQDAQQYREWQRGSGGGYSQETVADLIESTVDRYMARDRGSSNSSAELFDLVAGWKKISWRARAILSRYVKDEMAPPAIDVEMVRADVRILNLEGKSHHQESREIRETMAVRKLGKAMGGVEDTRRPFILRFMEAHHAMGRCLGCGKDISIGDRYASQRHQECYDGK